MWSMCAWVDICKKIVKWKCNNICLTTSAWKKATFPRQVMCDAINQRQGILMHSKVIKYYNQNYNFNFTKVGNLFFMKYIIATLPTAASIPDGSDTGKLKGWVYCGSHNATVSAWGKFTVSRDSKQPKMSIR